MQDVIDIMDKAGSLPVLVKHLEECATSTYRPVLLVNSSLVLISRYLVGWKGLYSMKPPALTEEGAFRLLQAWTGD